MYLHHNQSSRTELATSIKLLYKCIRSNLKLGTPRVQLEQIQGQRIFPVGNTIC